MCFHGNQLSWAIKHPVISLCLKYHSPGFICFPTILAPVISSLDEIYCTRSSISTFLAMEKHIILFFGEVTFSRGHATLHLAMSVGRSVGRSVGPSVTFLNSGRFSHYCSCPTVCDWIAVYPALFSLSHLKSFKSLHTKLLF